MHPFLLAALVLVSTPVLAQRESPFSPPRAKVQYAPDRDFDLQHIAVALDVDYEKKIFHGRADSTLKPLRSGLRQVRLHCGAGLEVSECRLNGEPAFFKREGEYLVLEAGTDLPQDREITASVLYIGGKKQGSGFGGEGGLHWLTPSPGLPNKIGFWTQGETIYNREWVPTWDYPNDFATSETRTTVPADWLVVGNGKKISESVKNGRRTVHWKMTQPHATYLLSLVAGPMDQKKARWENIELLYTVPKGLANLIDASFSDTPDMLSFFSRVTGVKYPWPKYAQSAVYDFGGGMENISATTLGAFSLAHPRDGFRPMASLNSHELAHQWFGDIVSCRDWGHTWLNESFATFFEWLYFEHSRGKHAYDREVAGGIQSYLGEARRYKRPIATNLYASPDSMFDSHSYPKGGAVLHMLRRRLGDKAFFKGVNLYLTRHRHQPVETKDLCRAMTDATGTNLAPFFEQWIFQPGHPVIEYDWTWDGDAVVLTVRQTQDTADGTPIYNIPTHVGVITGGKVERLPVKLDGARQELRLNCSVKPEALLLDPDREILAEWKRRFTPEERLAVALHAPCGIDQEEALSALVSDSPTEETLATLAAALERDTARFPAVERLGGLVALQHESLRPFWRKCLTHTSDRRRADAARALGLLPPTPGDIASLRTLALDETQPYFVVVEAVNALAALAPKESVDVFQKLRTIERGGVKRAVQAALRKAGEAK